LLASSALFPGRTQIGQYAAGMKLAPDYLKRKGYRLPTEAEWEYACRAGAVTRWYYGESEELLGKYAWHVGNSDKHSWPVGHLKPNDFGFFDMHGNVWVWCQKRYGFYPRVKVGKVIDDKEDSLIVDDSKAWVTRGGSFPDFGELL